MDPAISNCSNKLDDPAYSLANNNCYSNNNAHPQTNTNYTLDNITRPQANTSNSTTNNTSNPDNKTCASGNASSPPDESLSHSNTTNGGDMLEGARLSGDRAVHSDPLRFEIPFVFQEGTKDIENLTSDEMLDLYKNSSDLLEIPLLTQSDPDRADRAKHIEIFYPRIEPEHDIVRGTAFKIVAGHYGEISIDQIFAIYDYMRYGRNDVGEWVYVSDPSESLNEADSFRFANDTLRLGEMIKHSGVGDCDDFAIVMASLVRAIGGSSRIVVVQGENGDPVHAYSEVYLGILDEPDDDIYYLAELAGLKYNADRVYAHIDPSTKAVWLNLDAPMNLGEKAYPGCPFISGSAHYELGPNSNSMREIRYPEHRSLLNIVNEALNSPEGNTELRRIGLIANMLNSLSLGNATNESGNLTKENLVQSSFNLIASQGAFDIDMAKLALGNASTLPNANSNSTQQALNLAKLAKMLSEANQTQGENLSALDLFYIDPGLGSMVKALPESNFS